MPIFSHIGIYEVKIVIHLLIKKHYKWWKLI